MQSELCCATNSISAQVSGGGILKRDYFDERKINTPKILVGIEKMFVYDTRAQFLFKINQMCPKKEAKKKHGEYFMSSAENVHNKLIKWILPLKLCVCRHRVLLLKLDKV